MNQDYLDLCDRIDSWRLAIEDVTYIEPRPRLPHRHIAALLGYGTVSEMFDQWEDKDTEILEALCGPHGYAIYRMLLINRHLLPEEE